MRWRSAMISFSAWRHSLVAKIELLLFLLELTAQLADLATKSLFELGQRRGVLLGRLFAHGEGGLQLVDFSFEAGAALCQLGCRIGFRLLAARLHRSQPIMQGRDFRSRLVKLTGGVPPPGLCVIEPSLQFGQLSA